MIEWLREWWPAVWTIGMLAVIGFMASADLASWGPDNGDDEPARD